MKTVKSIKEQIDLVKTLPDSETKTATIETLKTIQKFSGSDEKECYYFCCDIEKAKAYFDFEKTYTHQ